MKTSRTRTRNGELINLTLVVIITIVFALFSLSINFFTGSYEYFSVYTTLPISEYFINLVFLWLVMTLWVTYHSWKKAIKRQKELEDIVASISADVLVVVDRDRNIIECNASVKRMFGYEVDEVSNQKIDLLYSDSFSDSWNRSELDGTLERDGFYIGLATGKKKSGDTVPLEIITGNRSDHNGAVLLLRDITERKESEEALQKAHEELEQQVKDRTAELVKANEQLTLQIVDRKQAEEALKRSEERYHDLIEFANVGIISSEEDTITQVNRKAEEIYGYSKEELIGQSPSILTPEKYRKEHQEIWDEILKSGEVKKMIFEEEGIRKDGSLFPVEISFSLTQLKKKNNIAVMRDITARKEMEEKLIQSEKLKSLGELAGGVAHDFNNILAAILGRAQLLKLIIETPQKLKEKRKLVTELKKGLDIIEKASKDGAETVKRIQIFSRRGDDDRHFTSVDINEILEDALEFTKLRWENDAESKGIKIKIKKNLSILPSVSGSEAELREVIINIINNAIDAMPQGGDITIKTFKEGNHACIKVTDTGIGVPQTMRDRIFDPFFTTKGPQSSGLGMSVSYGIIDRHRGSITVDSVEGKGSTFTIEVPFSEKTEEEEKVKPILSGQKKAKILIIEDEEDVSNLLKDILTYEGHGVETASNGKRGIEKFKKKAFDMVLTDLGMPGMSGWQVAEKIKGINGKVPIALITGWSIDLKESEMQERGIDFIIKKPYKLDQLVNIVQEGMILRERFKAV